MPVLSGVLLIVLAVIVFVNGWGVFNTDIKPEVYLAPQEVLPRYLSAWTFSPYLGSPNFNVGLVPVLAVTWLLRSLGLDPEMAFKVYHLILWGLAAWGANRLLRTLLPAAGRWAGLLAGVAYIANPYAVAAGGTLAIALPMALLPWLLIALTRSLREPTSWAWPAAVGLVFFAMSGMNVGVVPVYQLLLVIPLALFVRSERGRTWREIATSLGKSALFVLAVSSYWLVPGAAATSTGSQIVEGSESLDGIAKVSSFVEVLRGLGLWSYYGSSDAGPWLPEYAIYFTSGVVILFTLLWPAAALASLRVAPVRLARLVAAMTGMVAVIMVGLYPGGYGASPFAAALRVVLETVGPLEAFRTTNKIGAGLALAFALVLGVAAVRVLPRLARRPGLGPLAGGLGLATVAALIAPAVTGNLYVSPLDVPGYWEQAAKRVDQGDADKRVLLLPGQTRPHYRWTPERPDDLPNSLLHRDAVIPETHPNTSPPGGNFLAALDDTLQSGNAGSRDVSPFARYLGVDQVLLRHDIVWEDTGGARPGETAAALSEDDGLQGIANFGEPGQNTFTKATPPQSQEEALLPPLQLYGVKNSRAMVHATPTAGTLVVAGDAWSIPTLEQAGLLKGTPSIRYAHDMSGKQLQHLLDRDARMVLTDTNRRRSAITNRLTEGQGAVVAANEDPGTSRALGTAKDQSTLVRSGVKVKATMTGGAFFDLPHGIPENAIDGDPSTSWLFGDFGRAKGESLTLTLPTKQRLGKVTIDTTALGGVQIEKLAVTAGDTHRTVTTDAKGRARVDLDGVRAKTVKLRVDSLRGEGVSLVGIAEIDLGKDAPHARRTIRLPNTLNDLYGRLDAGERRDFTGVPLDVSFSRALNTDSVSDDTEQDLRRNFTLPDDRTFKARAAVRVDGPLEPLADRLSGMDTTYTARSNRTYFDDLDRRASRAADEDEATAWVPGGKLGKAWWQIEGPEREVPDIEITQEPGPGDDDDTAWATRARVLVDGEEVASGSIGKGTSTVEVPAGTTGERVRVELGGVDDSAGERPPRVSAIDTGVQIEQTGQQDRCVAVARIDGEPVRMRPEDPSRISGTGEAGSDWRGCGKEPLVWGEHQLRPVDGIQLDSLMLRDAQGSTAAQGNTAAHEVPAPVVQADRGVVTSSIDVEVGKASQPYFLAIGQGYDPRWRATLEDGTDLGEPVVVDGYATGWYVDDTAAHDIHISYTPQRRANVAMLVSGVALIAALVLFLTPLLRRRRDQLRTERAADWPVDELTEAATATVGGPSEGTPEEPVATPEPEEATTGGRRGRTRRERRHRGLTAALRARSGASRNLAEAALVIGALALTGIGGGLAALAVVLLIRRGDPRPGALLVAGAGLVVLAGVVFVAYLGLVTGTLGTVSADAVKSATVPHHIAGAGLVLAILATFLRRDP
ncbi:alpha-(1-_3)-arabinofuranosyltransferase domain-containing protein [Janibacter corallicola]|uniref:alpha-(1->3)-arabinofuranosyltransferase domain-containing protein n=1 Tax=Janibacter corallicola TaxID=415212 RepID=UPI00147053A0|nr:alpha-(1->3)-arabinofuranosyltransferase family protein [Janibacter corallicola]